MIERKERRFRVDNAYVNFDGKRVSEIISDLEKIHEKIPTAEVEFVEITYDDGGHFVVFETRLETEEEAKFRVNIEEERERALLKWQRNQYEQLRAKFERGPDVRDRS